MDFYNQMYQLWYKTFGLADPPIPRILMVAGETIQNDMSTCMRKSSISCFKLYDIYPPEKF